MQTAVMSPIGEPRELSEIIAGEQLHPVYQPIVDLHQAALFGYEALIRGPANSRLHSPLNLFQTAARHGMMAELEYACREVSCRNYAGFGCAGKLFLNVSPMSLVERGYRDGMTHAILARLGLPPERIVIELSEQYPLEDYDVMRNATRHFRDLGFEIAIDDLGSGYAGLRVWSELRPDYVKIDRHFIDHIHEDPVKREFVRSIQEIAQELDCRVVAEGIETADELAVVQAMGIRYGQGYYFGRPESTPASAGMVLDRLSRLELPGGSRARRSQAVGEMALTVAPISPDTPVDTVVELFRRNRQLSCLPVVESGQPVGMAERQEVLELYTARYTRELHGRKPVRHFMNRRPVIVAEDRSLESVSRLLTDNEDQPLSQDFIITRDEGYFGIGKTATLLRRITEQQIRNARHANPLTLLPGNVPVHELLEDNLAAGRAFRLAYCDINHFKAFNDYYGYSRGDDVIRCLAAVLLQVADPERDFIGHIGGDDFVMVLRSDDWRQRCEEALALFSERVQAFYDPDALARNGIWSRNRSGAARFFSLLDLSIGVVEPDLRSCRSAHDVSSLAVDAKYQAKCSEGAALFVSRRRRPVETGSTVARPSIGSGPPVGLAPHAPSSAD